MLYTEHTVALIKQIILLIKQVLLDISGYSEALINKLLCSGNVDGFVGHCLGTVSIILCFNLCIVCCRIHYAQGKFPQGDKTVYCIALYHKVIANLCTF